MSTSGLDTVIGGSNIASDPQGAANHFKKGQELDEDDEFEEFPSDEWDENCEDDDDINVWEDKWDDDNVEV